MYSHIYNNFQKQRKMGTRVEISLVNRDGKFNKLNQLRWVRSELFKESRKGLSKEEEEVRECTEQNEDSVVHNSVKVVSAMRSFNCFVIIENGNLRIFVLGDAGLIWIGIFQQTCFEMCITHGIRTKYIQLSCCKSRIRKERFVVN